MNRATAKEIENIIKIAKDVSSAEGELKILKTLKDMIHNDDMSKNSKMALVDECIVNAEFNKDIAIKKLKTKKKELNN